MKDEGFFFVRVSDICSGPVLTCTPGDDLVQVARSMNERNASGVVVCDQGVPVGVITDRDFRKGFATAGCDLLGWKAREIMSSPLISLDPADYVFEAIYLMSRHNIHRLPVVDAGGQLVGMVTDTDILDLQTTTPLYFNRDIETAGDFDALREVNSRILSVVGFYSRAGARTRDLVRLISHFNDAITRRAIELLGETEGVCLPEGAAFLALGSEGRMEQTLRTDQDNAVVYADDLGDGDVRQVERFSNRLIEALVSVGVPPCPGNTMANNPFWRRSLSEWKLELERWISTPTGENIVNFGMFADLRTVHGTPELETALHEHILGAVRRDAVFLPHFAKNLVRFRPPLGLFGRIRVERSGPNKGKIDLKKAGIFACTSGAILLSLEAGITEVGTWNKFEALAEAKAIDREVADKTVQAFTFLVYLRLKNQLRAVRRGAEPSNHVDPALLSPVQRSRLKESLSTVDAFLNGIRDRFQLDLMPH